MSSPPLVSVIVINYNGRDHLAECLSALCADLNTPPTEIIVVDNASTDDSQALIAEWARRVPQVIPLPSPVNRGYAGGVNAGLARARGPYIVALNPDMIVTPGWLTEPVAVFEAYPQVGALNPLILLHDTDHLINAAGQQAHVSGLGFNRWLGHSAERAGREPHRVSGVQGGAVIVRRELLERMGGWDESGFMYHEDVELSWLLQLMGYDLYCVPRSIVWHKYHLTMYPEKLFLLERNRLAMVLTYLELGGLLLVSPLLLCTEAMLWGYCLLRGPAFLRAKAATYQWLAQHRVRLAEHRAHIRALRRRTDWEMLRQLDWGYAWDQFFTLGRERGPSQRQPTGGMPVEL